MSKAAPKITYRQYGGKASIARWVVSYFPEHRVYMEPCCASAAVLLAKPKSFIEIINDLDDRIMGMWRAIKSQPEQLAALLWATPYTAANWREQPVGDIDQAVLLMAQGAQFYCGNGNSSTWSLDKCASPAQTKSRGLGRLVSAGAARRQSRSAMSNYCMKTPWSPSSESTRRPRSTDLRRSAVSRTREGIPLPDQLPRRWSDY